MMIVMSQLGLLLFLAAAVEAFTSPGTGVLVLNKGLKYGCCNDGYKIPPVVSKIQDSRCASSLTSSPLYSSATPLNAVDGGDGGGGAGGDYSLKLLPPPAWLKNVKDQSLLDRTFLISKEGGPTAEELDPPNLLLPIAEKCTDEELNWLTWKCLGYRYNKEQDVWTPAEVFPKWQAKYPEPPDFIGVKRNYHPDVDRPSFLATQSLIRSIPMEFKESLKKILSPLGFTGFMVNELTPNRTRRAQSINFICYYREDLWGYTLDQLRERRKERQAKEQLAPADAVKQQPAHTNLAD